ncbi:MAG TPA: hypothetical protein VL068_13730 [Microthrixaceae bacterium]|nr:hypothetical protein [Microthrixaceae bacterium]
MDDIDAEGALPFDVDSIVKRTQRRDIVMKFFDQRREVPTGTESPLDRMGRPDIYSLHGRSGERAATWFDEANGVCWLLGVVPQHDYSDLENRAANGELMPSQEDYELLFLARNNFDDQVASGLSQLLERAFDDPEVPQRGEVGGLLRLEVSIIVVEINETDLTDLYILVRQPPRAPGVDLPDGWPGSELMERLAELATDQPFKDLSTEFPSLVPSGIGQQRPVRFDQELAIEIHEIDQPYKPF